MVNSSSSKKAVIPRCARWLADVQVSVVMAMRDLGTQRLFSIAISIVFIVSAKSSSTFLVTAKREGSVNEGNNSCSNQTIPGLVTMESGRHPTEQALANRESGRNLFPRSFGWQNRRVPVPEGDSTVGILHRRRLVLAALSSSVKTPKYCSNRCCLTFRAFYCDVFVRKVHSSHFIVGIDRFQQIGICLEKRFLLFPHFRTLPWRRCICNGHGKEIRCCQIDDLL